MNRIQNPGEIGGETVDGGAAAAPWLLLLRDLWGVFGGSLMLSNSSDASEVGSTTVSSNFLIKLRGRLSHVGGGLPTACKEEEWKLLMGPFYYLAILCQVAIGYLHQHFIQ